MTFSSKPVEMVSGGFIFHCLVARVHLGLGATTDAFRFAESKESNRVIQMSHHGIQGACLSRGRTERFHCLAVTGDVDVSGFKKSPASGHSLFVFSTSD